MLVFFDGSEYQKEIRDYFEREREREREREKERQ